MFFDADIKGDRLPERTVCLTYDDGPGPQTREIGRFLHQRGIRATFFTLGRHAEADRDTLSDLARWGHLIGNHTFTHPGLVRFAREGGDVADELARADAIIRPYLGDGLAFFRAPYGNWRETNGESGPDLPVSPIARVLNRTCLAARYVGPVNWDVCGEDWDYWQRGEPAEACARRYVDEVHQAGRGIILMHDSSEQEQVRAGNRSFEATVSLVDALLREGYRFVGLDDVPQVRSALAVHYRLTLGAPGGSPMASDKEGRLVARADGVAEAFGVVELPENRIALRAANGLFVSAPEDGGPLFATALTAGEREAFTLEADGDVYAIACPSGAYWSLATDGTVHIGSVREVFRTGWPDDE